MFKKPFGGSSWLLKKNFFSSLLTLDLCEILFFLCFWCVGGVWSGLNAWIFVFSLVCKAVRCLGFSLGWLC